MVKAFSLYESSSSWQRISKILIWCPAVEFSKKGWRHKITHLKDCRAPSREEAFHLAKIVFQEMRFDGESMIVKHRIIGGCINMTSSESGIWEDHVGSVFLMRAFLQKYVRKNMACARSKKRSVPALPA